MRNEMSISAAAASTPDRNLVLWWGPSPPLLLTAECWRMGLTVRPTDRDSLEEQSPCARILVMEVPTEDSTFATWGSEIIAQVHGHGLGVALVQNEVDGDLPHMEDEEAVQNFFAAVKALRRDSVRAKALYRDWARVARWACAYETGPAANFGLVLQGDVPEAPAAQLLLRRAFHDLTSVSLELLSGGKSGASVWRACPSSADLGHRSLPFVVKVHTREKMHAERSNYSIVRNAVESHLYAPLYEDRCVSGDALSLVAYDVVERAIPFRASLPSAPEVLITSLFAQTLRGFRARATECQRPLVSEFEQGRLKALNWSAALEEAAEQARITTPSAPSVAGLRSLATTLPPMAFVSATVHGDLHGGNLFVRANSPDVLMIDYGSVLNDAPVVADPACLEVSLSFPAVVDSTSDPLGLGHPSEEWLRAIYRYPLDPPGVPSLSGSNGWLPQAIRTIRLQARADDPRPTAYAVAIASYLLRFASHDDSAPLAQRALAYELAASLIIAVERSTELFEVAALR
jgi:hypothetical protein